MVNLHYQPFCLVARKLEFICPEFIFLTLQFALTPHIVWKVMKRRVLRPAGLSPVPTLRRFSMSRYYVLYINQTESIQYLNKEITSLPFYNILINEAGFGAFNKSLFLSLLPLASLQYMSKDTVVRFTATLVLRSNYFCGVAFRSTWLLSSSWRGLGAKFFSL